VGFFFRGSLAARAAVITCVLAAGLALAGSAQAARVLVRMHNGHVAVRTDRYVPAAQPLGVPVSATAARPTRATLRGHRGAARAASAGPTVLAALQGLYQQKQISSAAYTADQKSWNQALSTDGQLSGTPAAELGAVIANMRQIAASGLLTASRLPEVFLTINRNVQWWTTGVVPGAGQDVEFSGSQIVWEYYPGQGIELQVLGTFGKADGLYTGGEYTQMLSLVNEMLPLAANRNGALTWEYLFQFENGLPPWTSAMSQGTAIEALTRAGKASTAQGDTADASNYFSIAHQALAILQQAPPEGVAVQATHGTRFLLYSYNPNELVINGFLQTLIGLWDYWHASGDTTARALFKAASPEAQYELPSYDTGAWSLYEPGQEDTLSYHQLVTGFLQQLCDRTGNATFCTEASHFNAYLKTPPVIRLLDTTSTGPAGSDTTVSFTLSKISNVTLSVLNGSQTVFTTTSQVPYGTDSFSVPALSAGSYTVNLTATDLAGNVATTSGALNIH
jgi:D-glucuronyl C5-epimerase C-terminus/Bacterial Ig-like domain